MNDREQRGLTIAALSKITRKGNAWLVPSQSAGAKKYTVVPDVAMPHCTCPDHETRGAKCKHIYAVEFFQLREEQPDGTIVETRQVVLTETKKTYRQNWPAYNAAQVNEKSEFQSLLADLCRTIPDLPHVKGRKPIPLSDAIFAVVFKIYSTFSGRRFISDLRDANEKGHISKVPHFNSIFNYLENPALTPILQKLIAVTSLPMQSIETDFACDSTGFTSSRFHRWFDHKYGAMRQEHDWVKLHICCGVKTNIVTAAEIHQRNSNDSPILPSLLSETAKSFDVQEMSADKQYASESNFQAIADHGAKAFIPFRVGTTGSSGGLFAKAFHYFQFNREDFMNHYHKRSNVESTVMMIKTKFGDAVRCKTDTAMKNEVFCKVICHNICCLISAIYELGLEPVFGCTKTNEVAQYQGTN